MIRRPIRLLCLVVGGWAVVFAPGAVSGDFAGASPSVDPDRVAAAVLAPTLDPGEMLLARQCRAVTDQVPVDCAGSGAAFILATALVLAAEAWSRSPTLAPLVGPLVVGHPRLTRGPPRR